MVIICYRGEMYIYIFYRKRAGSIRNLPEMSKEAPWNLYRDREFQKGWDMENWNSYHIVCTNSSMQAILSPMLLFWAHKARQQILIIGSWSIVYNHALKHKPSRGRRFWLWRFKEKNSSWSRSKRECYYTGKRVGSQDSGWKFLTKGFTLTIFFFLWTSYQSL